MVVFLLFEALTATGVVLLVPVPCATAHAFVIIVVNAVMAIVATVLVWYICDNIIYLFDRCILLIHGILQCRYTILHSSVLNHCNFCCTEFFFFLIENRIYLGKKILV